MHLRRNPVPLSRMLMSYSYSKIIKSDSIDLLEVQSSSTGQRTRACIAHCSVVFQLHEVEVAPAVVSALYEVANPSDVPIVEEANFVCPAPGLSSWSSSTIITASTIHALSTVVVSDTEPFDNAWIVDAVIIVE